MSVKIWARLETMPARMESKCDMSWPSVFPSFRSMQGGLALTRTAFETRLEPWRARNRVTSPPPVEWPTSMASLMSRCSKRVRRSSDQVSMLFPSYFKVIIEFNRYSSGGRVGLLRRFRKRYSRARLLRYFRMNKAGVVPKVGWSVHDRGGHVRWCGNHGLLKRTFLIRPKVSIVTLHFHKQKDSWRLTIFPVITVKRPTMTEHDWLPSGVAPVLIIDFRLVFRSDERHCAQTWAGLTVGDLDVR
jgi:hypothetical protein